MSATTPIPDNALLLWLQDESNNECTTAESITQMYTTMHTDEFDLISHYKQDGRHHCFLIFEKVAHLAVAPTRIGNPTPHDGHWHLAANQPIGGHQITVNLLRDLFTQGNAVQTFVPNHIQGEVGNEPDLEQLIPEISSDANLEDLELMLDDDLSPVSTWVRVYGAILQNGHLDACRPLVQFLQDQLLGNSASNTHPFLGLAQTFASASLIRHRNAMLSHLITTVALGAPHAPAPTPSSSTFGSQSACNLLSCLQQNRACLLSSYVQFNCALLLAVCKCTQRHGSPCSSSTGFFRASQLSQNPVLDSSLVAWSATSQCLVCSDNC